MRKTTMLACALALGGGTVALAKGGHGGKPSGTGGGKGRPARLVGDLARPETSTDANDAGKVDVKHFPAVGHRVERSWLRFKLRHLESHADYTLWMDDPTTAEDATLVQVGTEASSTNGDGNANLFFDTKKGGLLPFGSTLADLAGKAVEVRDGLGNVVLSGTVPTLP